jgi:uncharacterized protein (TIGR02266 family)
MGERQNPSDRRQSENGVEQERRVADRRHAVRAPIDMWMEESKGNELYFRRTGNLSSGGVYFEQSIPHPLGTHVSLRFSLPGQDYVIETTAEIVNTPGDKDGLGMGVRFLEMSDDARKRIDAFVKNALELRPGK